MRHDHLDRELELILLMAENRTLKPRDICERLNISLRTFYYYVDFFRLAGFDVVHERPYYWLSRESRFFRRLNESVNFTEEETVVMRRLLEKVDSNDVVAERLKQKFDRFYDLDLLADVKTEEHDNHCVSQIYEAMKKKRMVVLCNYSSPHSNTCRNREVEPFLLMSGNREVRCYEPSSKQNKTFKISRMGDVKVLDLLWSHEDCHREMFTDAFHFSGETTTTVTLRMGRLATELMREEYPRAERFIDPDDESHWTISIPVCSYAGIGRFVLGLPRDIEVLGDEGFKKYLEEQRS